MIAAEVSQMLELIMRHFVRTSSFGRVALLRCPKPILAEHLQSALHLGAMCNLSGEDLRAGDWNLLRCRKEGLHRVF